jgi:hypothetical protein
MKFIPDTRRAHPLRFHNLVKTYVTLMIVLSYVGSITDTLQDAGNLSLD